MTVRTILVSEPHPLRRGFFRHLYALVKTERQNGYWVWQQIDEHGHTLSDAERAFPTEDAALSDAVNALKGEAVVAV